jgi:serine/threonine protein kinase
LAQQPPPPPPTTSAQAQIDLLGFDFGDQEDESVHGLISQDGDEDDEVLEFCVEQEEKVEDLKSFATEIDGMTVTVVHLASAQEISRQNAAAFIQDVSTLTSFRHQNVVTCYGWLPTDTDLYGVHENLESYSTSLFDYIHAKKNLSEPGLFRIINQLASAVENLHSHDIIHGCICSRNVLLDAANMQIKLANACTNHFFGVPDIDDDSIYVPVDNIHWASPERLCALVGKTTYSASVNSVSQLVETYDTRDFDRKACDIYSFGIVLYELGFRRIPFESMSVAQVLAWVGYGRQSIDCTMSQPSHKENVKWLQSTISACTSTDPSIRPKAAVILEKSQVFVERLPWNPDCEVAKQSETITAIGDSTEKIANFTRDAATELTKKENIEAATKLTVETTQSAMNFFGDLTNAMVSSDMDKIKFMGTETAVKSFGLMSSLGTSMIDKVVEKISDEPTSFTDHGDEANMNNESISKGVSHEPELLRLPSGKWVQVHGDLRESFPGDRNKWRDMMSARIQPNFLSQ